LAKSDRSITAAQITITVTLAAWSSQHGIM